MSAHALAGCSAPAAFGTLKPASLLTFAVSASPDNPPATASGGWARHDFVAAFCRAAPPCIRRCFASNFNRRSAVPWTPIHHYYLAVMVAKL